MVAIPPSSQFRVVVQAVGLAHVVAARLIGAFPLYPGFGFVTTLTSRDPCLLFIQVNAALDPGLLRPVDGDPGPRAHRLLFLATSKRSAMDGSSRRFSTSSSARDLRIRSRNPELCLSSIFKKTCSESEARCRSRRPRR